VTTQQVVDRRSTARILLSGATWNAVAQFAPVLVNIVMTPYLIHHLGVDRWGLIALVTTIESILTSFDGGLTESTTRYFAMYAGTDDRRLTTRTLLTVLMFIFGAGLVVGVIGWFVTPTLVHLFAMPSRFRPETTFYLRAVVAVIALGFARNSIAAVVTARQRYALMSLLSLTTYLIWIIGLVLTVHGGWGLRGVAVTFLAQQLAATLIIVPQALRYLDRRAVRPLPWAEARKLFAYSGRVQISGLSRLANAEFDSLVIGTLLSVHALAMYSAGAGLATQVSGIFSNAMGPAGTHMGRVYGAEGDAGARRTFFGIQRIWVVACNALYAVAMGASYYAVVDWLGPGFSVAGVIATVMVAGQGVLVLASMLALYCITVGRADIEMRVGIVAVCVNVVLTAGLIFVGVLGVVAATVVAWLVSSWYLIHDARSKVSPDLPSFLDDLSPVATVATVGVVFFLEYLLRPLVPTGPLGFVAAVGPGLIGLLVFVVVRVGPRLVLTAGRELAASRTEGPRAAASRLAAMLMTSVADLPVQARIDPT
jgi:O-antigen/teichoic acid export membrane protein